MILIRIWGVSTSNAYIPSQGHRDMSVVPVYDDYRVLFDKCNKFNKRLCIAPGHIKRVDGISCLVLLVLKCCYDGDTALLVALIRLKF